MAASGHGESKTSPFPRFSGLKNENQTTALRRIGAGTNWTDIAVSDHSCVAIKSDGTLWGWGQDMEGTTASNDTPVQIFPDADWKQVAVGNGGLAIKRDGTLWAWGENSAGQLGIGGTTQASDPVQVGTSTNWVRIWSSSIQTVGLQSDGSLWFCGALEGAKAGRHHPRPHAPIVGHRLGGCFHRMVYGICRQIRWNVVVLWR